VQNDHSDNGVQIGAPKGFIGGIGGCRVDVI